MQAGDYTTDGVPEPVQRRIYVNGVHRHHVSDSWDAEIGSDLPEQVSGVTGIKARTGTVTFAPVETVVDQVPAPARRAAGWPPKRGDVLTITDATETQHWTRVTARVVEVSADLGSGIVTVDWSDDLDSALSQTTELPAQAWVMPGAEVSESGVLKRHWHRTGLEPWAYVVEALEDAGMLLLPSLAQVDFYALFQGTAYPRIGQIQQTYSDGDLLAWDTESGFQYLAQWSYFTPGFVSRDSGDGVVVHLRATQGGPTAQTRWTTNEGTEIQVSLSASSAIVTHTRDGVSTTLVQRGFTNTSPLPWASVYIGASHISLWTQDGRIDRDYGDIPGAGTVPIVWTRVRVLGAAALAVQYIPYADFPPFSSWPSLRFRAWGASLVYGTRCARAVEKTTVKALLDKIAAASLTGYWLDEHGILQWAPSVQLEQQAPVETITTRMDVLSGSWTETGGGVSSEVTVSYEETAMTRKSVVGVNVAEASSGKIFEAGDSEEQFVGPEADEEWIEPDMSPLPAGQNTDLMTTDARNSWWGGSYVHQLIYDENDRPVHDSTVYQWANLPFVDYLRFDISQVSTRRWRYTHRVLPGAKPVELVTLPNSSTLPIPWRDRPLPIWRARGLVKFTDAQVSYRRGPSWAPAYQHDIGSWGNRADAQRVGDYLATRMSTIQVVLSRLSVVPDPRRQLGDVVEVAAQGVLGAALRALVVGIHESTDDGGHLTQALDLRIIRTTPSDPSTYAELEASASSYAGPESRGTYQAIEEA